jgi:LCP family protein required for cell wall assembly
LFADFGGVVIDGAAEPGTTSPETPPGGAAAGPGEAARPPDAPATSESDQEPGTAPAGPAEGDGKRRAGFVRRHKILIAVGVLFLLVACSAGGYYYWVNNRLSSIARVPTDIVVPPGKDHGGEKQQPLNILLLGADAGQEQDTVAEDLEDGTWTPFLHRSDTLMIAHVPADRDSVQIVSIPRDTWVPIRGYPDDNGHGKLNAAFAYGGPSLAIKTVEDLTGVHIDHMAIIDWAGFKDLTSALGGVRVYIPETFYDDSQNIEWTQGWHTFEGQEALAYVRTRHGLANGDFDRIHRQQNFIRATMNDILSSSKNVITMTKVINTVTRYLTIDDTWDNDEIRNLALSLRNLHSSDVEFVTAPLGTYDTVGEESIVRLDRAQSRELFEGLRDDDLGAYLEQYPDENLGGDKQVE